MDPILKVTDLSKSFSRTGKSEFFAVNQVSFAVMPGEILGIVGESGSGKSTIAKLITRQIDATAGKIEIEGQDITGLKGREMIPVYAKIQMVFQTPAGSFDPRRTLGDGICESLRNRGTPKPEREAKARGLLEQCGLPGDFLERYPHQVSGGQCQRAAIARALMCDPKILILDEATSALDVTVQKQIMELLQELQKKKGLAYLFICHNLALVQQFCDKVIVLCDGKIVEQGLPDDVILRPKSEYAKRLVDSVF
ncbi:MAG: dipeptide/oligopeptide/nickel ABC transporter ATP-binding protein [Succiniclasticum sp.]|uniref:ABC transporter ATP-binding protein n=1 Tax=Succiniclasticum sp. TaxID=2775030 RepID=UPI002A91BCE6|nr:dipeptide/oligopeptide/nickel ABC transporter ATP-binding protein [Succiniclasticum sp.]MDY6290155.1 dipeptide/oligopeptide/nickel ABC transporter ATP-binding protein [Succiniclasticum sp.]